MKKLFCLLTCLFIGFFAFAENYEEKEVTEFDEPALKYMGGIENVTVVGKYKFYDVEDITKFTETNIDTWTLCSQRKVKTLTEIPYYYLFIVKNKDEGDLFFVVLESKGFFEKYYIIKNKKTAITWRFFYVFL